MTIRYTSDNYQLLKDKWGSDENFFNCTINKLDSRMDSELVDICKKFNRNGMYTVSSCYGHKNSADMYIMFASFITKSKVEEYLKVLGTDLSKMRLEVRNRVVIVDGKTVESYKYLFLVVYKSYKDIFVKL